MRAYDDSKPTPGKGQRWAIVLAGGEGDRMKAMIQGWLGSHRPKQYCTFVGNRSMFEHTLDRAIRLVGPNHIVTVIGRGHRRFLDNSRKIRIPGRVIEQPAARDTAGGVLLPATYILATDPEATVVILPSDHYVFPEPIFLTQMNRAYQLAESLRDRLILVGAVPDQPETDYGWIEPGLPVIRPSCGRLYGVACSILSFHEKPTRDEALQWFARGYFWNTMIVVGKIRTLWYVARSCMPKLMIHFERLLEMVAVIQREPERSTAIEDSVLFQLYESMPAANFSTGLLAGATKESLVLPLAGVDWSDWGSPRRVVESLARLGKRPNFLKGSLSSVG